VDNKNKDIKSMDTKILIIEDDELLAATFQRFLKGAGYGADVAGDYAGGKELLTSGSYGAVFMDINLQGKQTGIDLLREIREINIDTPVVIITGYPEVATAAEAVRNAAFDYLCKPIEKDQLLRIASAAVRHKILSDEKKRHHQNLEAAFRSVRDAIVMADLDMPITGRNEAAQAAANPESLLSEREKQILSMLGQGESSSDIAAVFFISTRTVETYFSRIIAKLKLDGMKELRRYAIRNKQL
jgi:DNA-binding NarL/FixJ family response regulator